MLKKFRLEETKRNNLLIGYKIPNVNCVKYLGVYLDCTLSFKEQMKRILNKMAARIKTLEHVFCPFPEQTRLLVLNALVISLLHYSGHLLDSSRKSCIIILEKQLSWAVKMCYNHKTHDSSSDQKLKHRILPIKFFLECKALNYFMKLAPNFRKIPLPTSNLRYKQQTKKYCVNHKKTHLH